MDQKYAGCSARYGPSWMDEYAEELKRRVKYLRNVKDKFEPQLRDVYMRRVPWKKYFCDIRNPRVPISAAYHSYLNILLFPNVVNEQELAMLRFFSALRDEDVNG